MGRYDFRPLRVRQHASQLLETKRIHREPCWYSIIGDVPPAQAIVRTQPVQHHEQQRRRSSKWKKPSRMFQPQRITYQEDQLRQDFFGDHPWELARPRVVLENDGKDYQRSDWSRIRQPGRRLDGESVIQRQLWLLHNVAEMTQAKAYDQARHEFYEVRHQEDVERRVAQEEALATGAYFGKTALEVGMELEDKAYEDWKEWAVKEIAAVEQAKSAAYTGLDSERATIKNDDPETEASIGEIEDSIPAKGQDALGGAAVHP
ncbi:MAG: hypothetical protein M1819_006569 [Sarea resinae]|nr:MAG: hypothetical protein M1819_006569 [Sarea resinae]